MYLSYNITLLIPTKNRSQFVERLLLFYKDMNFQGVLAIGDSSQNEHLEKTRYLVSQLKSDLNIIFEECPGLNQLQATAKLFNKVQTDFVAELQDDNFLVPQAIRDCIEFLENNLDYSAARGLGLSIKTKDSEVYGQIKKCVRKKQPVAEEDTSAERYLKLMGDYSDVHFSVFRSNIYSMLAEKYHNPDVIFFHTLSSSIAFICGKVKELNRLYLVRQIQDNPLVGEAHYDTMLKWLSNENWNMYLKQYRDLIIHLLMNNDNLNFNEAQKVFENGFITYLSIRFSQFVQSKDKEYAKFLMEYYYQLTFYKLDGINNDMIVKGFRYLYFRIRVLFEKFKYRLVGGEILTNDILSKHTRILLPSLLNKRSKYHEDFMPIYKSITNPPEKYSILE